MLGLHVIWASLGNSPFWFPDFFSTILIFIFYSKSAVLLLNLFFSIIVSFNSP